MNKRNGYGSGGRADTRMNTPFGDRSSAYGHGRGMGGPGPMMKPGMEWRGEYGLRLAPQTRFEGDLPFEEHVDKKKTWPGMEKRGQNEGCPTCGIRTSGERSTRTSGPTPAQTVIQETEKNRAVPCCEAGHRAAEENRRDYVEEQEHRTDDRRDCGCGDNHGESVLGQIQVLDFALYEVALYLDAYPYDCQALELYHRLLDQRNGLVSRYECETGPLTFRGNKSRTQWDWTNEPFPWDIEANQ